MAGVLDGQVKGSYAVQGKYKDDEIYHHVYRTKFLDVAIDIANQNNSDLKMGTGVHRVLREDDNVVVHHIGSIKGAP